MAYGLKYYKDLAHPDGKVVRLEILEKDYSGASKSIGPVCQSLRLDIQGDTEIDAPIVKTSLSMTFVDAPDHEEAATKKCGNWDEFYTSDATKWQVVLKYKKPKQTSFTTMWGGYITPDSFNEVLIYRGSINIVARDNIGHMNDFLFDSKGEYDGMISLLVLVNEAWEKIGSPMVLDTQAMFQSEWINSSGTPAYNTYMNISAFEGKTWFEALESALYAYGLVMRYVGDNHIVFYPLRNLPRMGAENLEDISFIEPLFVDGAERELTPAVRIIEESVDYDIQQSVVMPQIQKGEFTGATDEYTCEIEGVEIDGSKFGTLEHQAPVWPIANERGENWANAVPDATLFFNPHAYEIGYFSKAYEEEIRRYMYIAANNKGGGTVKFSQYINCFDMVLSIKFGTPIGLNRSNAIERAIPVNLYKITYAITLTLDGITEYYRGNGSWTAEYKELVAEYDATQSSDTFSVAIGMDDRVGRGLLTFHIIKIEYKQTSLLNLIQFGLYACIQSLTFDIPSDVSMIEKNNVNTNFDKQNNVILSRDPKIAPALNNVILPGFIKNGIFTRTAGIYNPAKTWNWGGQTPQQLAVYNHLQLLCYHSKPNNILRGTIVNGDITDMQVIWVWQEAEHMLVSGTLDLISGYIENAVLREFARYENMWGILDEADFPDVEGNSSTNVEGGSASKNEGTRATNNTEVYLGGGAIELDSFMSDSSENGVMNRVIKAYVDDVRTDLTDLWHLDENGNLVTEHQVIIKNNAIINADLSFVGNGEGGGGGLDEGQLQDYLDLHKYITEDALSSYYTKAESDGKYLAQSGGILYNGYSDMPLYIKGDSAGAYIGFMKSTGEFIGYYGFTETTPMVWCGVTASYSLIHSGNIGSQSVAGIRIGEQIRTQEALDAFNDAQNLRFVGVGSVLPSPIVASDGIVISIPWYNTTFGAQIAIDDQSNVMLLRTRNQNVWNPWYQFITAKDDGYVYGLGGMIDIQYTDEINRYGGNLYLQHRGMVAGEGTGGNYTGHVIMCANGGNVLIGTMTDDASHKVQVDGALKVYEASERRLYTRINSAVVQFGVNTSLYTGGWNGGVSIGANNSSIGFVAGAYLEGGTLFKLFYGGTSQADASIVINGLSGNVGIKNATPQYELDVIGGIKATKPIFGYMYGTNNNAAAFIFGKPGLNYTGIGSDGVSDTIRFGACDINGTWVSYNQKWKFYGDVIVTGDFSFGSDMRFKDIIKDKTIKIEHIAKAPLFTFKWNDRDDDTIYLGSSAQYWENIAPWLVSGSDFKSLNYATLGVAMGISLAKKTINHEERIKVLEAEIKRLKREQYGN